VSSTNLKHFAAVLFASLLFLPGAAAQEESEPPSWHGFVQVREQFPLTTGFLLPEPTSGFTLPAGDWRFDVSLTLSNTFSSSQEVEQTLSARTIRAPFTEAEFRAIAATDLDDQSFYLDTQIARTAFRLHRGLGRGFEIGVLVPLIDMNGGFTDAAVEAFHDLFPFDQEGRKGVLRDQFDLFLLGQGREMIIDRAPGSKLGDIVLDVKKTLVASAPSRSLALGASIKLPTGDDESLVSSGATDVGLDILGTWCWRSRCVHASAGYVFAGESNRFGTESQALFFTGTAFEQRFSDRWSMVVQGLYWQSYLDDLVFEHLAEDTIQLSLAFLLRTATYGEFVVGFSENAFSFKNSADANWHAGWRWSVR
jgi:hypothetical protein